MNQWPIFYIGYNLHCSLDNRVLSNKALDLPFNMRLIQKQDFQKIDSQADRTHKSIPTARELTNHYQGIKHAMKITRFSEIIFLQLKIPWFEKSNYPGKIPRFKIIPNLLHKGFNGEIKNPEKTRGSNFRLDQVHVNFRKCQVTASSD